MWISVPENLQEIKHPEMDAPVDVSDGEAVQVKENVGELLIEYDDITEHNPE